MEGGRHVQTETVRKVVRRLTRRERNAIERMLDRNRSACEIAVELGRSLSTVTRGAWGGDTPPRGRPNAKARGRKRELVLARERHGGGG